MYDDAKAAVREAEGELQEIKRHWQAELEDRTIDWPPPCPEGAPPPNEKPVFGPLPPPPPPPPNERFLDPPDPLLLLL